MKLANKIAIITGAAGGMGQAAAILFAQEGAKIAVVDLQESAAQPTVDEIKANDGQAIAIGADITRTDDVQRIVERTVKELGLLGISGRVVSLSDAYRRAHRALLADSRREGRLPAGACPVLRVTGGARRSFG
jgi:NAD(P)-dependent dehydrogenase (short-subunit alcohol dehydrogenase family)